MGSRTLDIMVLVDFPYPPPAGRSIEPLLVGDDWKDERHVMRALRSSGHDVRIFGVFDEIEHLTTVLRETPPDLVFVLCESYRCNRNLEPNLIGLLDLYGIPYTGSGPEALQLCKDKSVTKKILQFHGIHVPDFFVSAVSRPVRSIREGFPFPGLCKPLGLDASEGIARDSLVISAEESLERIDFIHRRFKTDAIVEEYIPGREIYLGIVGNERLTVFPPRELLFLQVPATDPKIATYKAKWDKAYRKRWGIDSAQAKGIDPKVVRRLEDVGRIAFRELKLQGYARIDLRLRDNGDIVFIEANPNPCIARNDDFASAARAGGIEYPSLIGKIVNLAMSKPLAMVS